jgi:lysozyme
MVITDIISQLKRDEGFRADMYEDAVGKHTVGYGHNLDANPLPDLKFPITEVQATQILGVDVERISALLQRELPWVVSLDDARHGVLQNLGFNIGVGGLLKFYHMLAYMSEGKYVGAAEALVQSEWYNEVGDRAKRLVQQALTGVWQ